MVFVNPNPRLAEIRVVNMCSLFAETDHTLDVVEVFCRTYQPDGIAEEEVAIGVKTHRGQIGLYEGAAVKPAEEVGLKVVKNRC